MIRPPYPQPQGAAWVEFRPEWRETECPRCEHYVNVGERVLLKAQLGDGYVEVEHVLCPRAICFGVSR